MAATCSWSRLACWVAFVICSAGLFGVEAHSKASGKLLSPGRKIAFPMEPEREENSHRFPRHAAPQELTCSVPASSTASAAGVSNNHSSDQSGSITCTRVVATNFGSFELEGSPAADKYSSLYRCDFDEAFSLDGDPDPADTQDIEDPHEAAALQTSRVTKETSAFVTSTRHSSISLTSKSAAATKMKSSGPHQNPTKSLKATIVPKIVRTSPVDMDEDVEIVTPADDESASDATDAAAAQDDHGPLLEAWTGFALVRKAVEENFLADLRSSLDGRASKVMLSPLKGVQRAGHTLPYNDHFRRKRSELAEDEGSKPSKDAKGKISANPGYGRLELKSLNLVPTTIRALVIPDTASEEDALAAASEQRRQATSSDSLPRTSGLGSFAVNQQAAEQQLLSPAEKADGKERSRPDDARTDKTAISASKADEVEFDQSIVPTEEPLGVALLNSVQMWYMVSLVLASFFVMSIIINIILCCAFKKKFSSSSRSASDLSIISGGSPVGSSSSAGSGSKRKPRPAVYTTGSNDFLVVQEIDEAEARRLERKSAEKAISQGKSKWNKFFLGSKSRKETVIEYDNRSQLSQLFHWGRGGR